MKRAIVTGGAGFIGSHVVDCLIERGIEVLVIDDLSSGSLNNLNTKAQLEKIDIGNPELEQVIKRFCPEVVVHAAAQISVSNSMKDPVNDAKVNLCGLLNLLQALKHLPTLPYLLFISTGGAMYGEQDIYPAPESHKIAPTSVYGQSKYASELYLDLWKRVYQLPFGVLRLANVYGPRQNPHGEAGVVAIFSKKLLKRETPKIFGTGEFTRDYIYVSDVAAAVLAMLDRKQSGVYNIGTGAETSVNQIYALLSKAAGLDLKPEYAAQRPGDQARSSIDPTLAYEKFEWQSKIKIEEGLALTWQWFYNNKE